MGADIQDGGGVARSALLPAASLLPDQLGNLAGDQLSLGRRSRPKRSVLSCKGCGALTIMEARRSSHEKHDSYEKSKVRAEDDNTFRRYPSP